MSLHTRKHFLLVSLAIAMLCLLPNWAAAQQVTYYTFDGVNTAGANAAGGYTYTCANPQVTNPILCFNDSTGSSGVNPSLSTDECSSGDTRCPYSATGVSHSTIQMTPAAGVQRASMWFSIPQKVLNGFTSYFAFRLSPCLTTPCVTGGVVTADGITFAVQNAAGSVGAGAGEAGSGLTVIGGNGGEMGYGGIDNSLVTELDTYANSGFFDPNDNHMAVQSCGTAANSPIHGLNTGSCQVGSGINSSPGVTLADGHIHEVVVEYSGETGTPANLYQVYIDPQFVSGTHTPCPGADNVSCSGAAQPVLSVTYDLGTQLTLLNPDSQPVPDSAYVGFTAATGADFETQEILAWTFTPHTTSTQQQPINNPGTPTTFPFGAHTYAVTYPTDQGVNPSDIDMVVAANTLSPSAVSALLVGSNFVGSACQQYDSTGGNCVVYSVYCVTHGTTTPAVACPSTADPLIAVKTAFDSDPLLVPLTPGFLQGDPLYSQISSIQVNSGVATVTCSGECAVHDGQTVSIINANPASYDAANVTVSNSTANIYTFNFPYAPLPTGTYVGGAAVTSNNLQDICNPPGNPVPCWQAARIDGTISGRTKNFSDFVALFSTVTSTGATISAPAITYGQPALITVSVTPAAATGNVSLTVGSNPALNQPLSAGSTTFVVNGLPANSYNLSASYAAQGIYGATSAVGTLTVSQATPTVTVVGGTYTYDGNTHAATGSVTGVNGENLGTPAFTYNGSSTPPSAPGTYTVRASFAGNTNYLAASATTSIVISSALGLSSYSLAFGNVDLTSRTDQTFTVTNVSKGSLKITNIYFNYGPGSGKDYGYFTQCGGTLTMGQSCTIRVELHAQDLGAGSAILGITYNLPGSPALVNLSGTVINPRAGLNEDELNFGTHKVGSSSTQTITLTSTGDTPLLIQGVTVSGSSDFTTSSCPASLAVNSSCTITVTFKPSAKQSRSGTLVITDNALSSPQTVSLSGRGD
jgi:hypothetical protein